MNRRQAHDLWFSTLALGREDVIPARLKPLWSRAGLLALETEPLTLALKEPDVDERRRLLIQTTRRLLQAAGFVPDLLSTPAAQMRGL